MSLARAWSVALYGVDGRLVEIESDIGIGLPGVHLVGLPDASLHESKDRVRAAIVKLRPQLAQPPDHARTLPGDAAQSRERGSTSPSACAVLAACGVGVAQRELDGTVLIGELALDGRLRPVRGVLPSLLAARRSGVRRVVIPEETLHEASLVEGWRCNGAGPLNDVLGWLSGDQSLPRPPPLATVPPDPPPDLADVVGQTGGRLALEGRRGRRAPPDAGGPSRHGQEPCSRSGWWGCCPIWPPTRRLQIADQSARSRAGLPVTGPLSLTPPFVAPHHYEARLAAVGRRW